MASSSKAYTVMGLVATLGATVVARKLLTAGWKLSTGKEPPANPESPDVSVAEAVAWAAISGLAVGLARMLASRKAADYYRRSTGKLPPNLQDASS